ncbi:anti-sigma F factor antagonist [Clostridium uliginosum]|uniref:Anti-sigma F factor antagonist n=1 Tax=Clostridium uliginosum TaxID=119641 RepID=A0A1I1KTI4_9CLOT|nr:anti-sigma F factor antagonist [Clostridium uliginosum]SFC62008.1 stage II sporulation protein AA (anti-sigma F factor antagonist) [Clostridium uliginosum]
MNLKFEKHDDILIITFIGELDHHSAEEVRVKIDDRIDRDNIEKVILNFSGVSFMDSSGIGVVVGRHKKISNKGGSLCIAKVSGNVNKVFELTGLYKVIKNYNTVDEAVRCI